MYEFYGRRYIMEPVSVRGKASMCARAKMIPLRGGSTDSVSSWTTLYQPAARCFMELQLDPIHDLLITLWENSDAARLCDRQDNGAILRRMLHNVMNHPIVLEDTDL